MAIKQKKNGKYLVDARDEYGTRIHSKVIYIKGSMSGY